MTCDCFLRPIKRDLTSGSNSSLGRPFMASLHTLWRACGPKRHLFKTLNSETVYPCLRLKTLKTIPCSATPTRTGQIRECPSGETSNPGKKKTVKRQADTKTQWNTWQVSLFYSFHFIHSVSPHHHHQVPSTSRGRLSSWISSFSDIPLFLRIIIGVS